MDCIKQRDGREGFERGGKREATREGDETHDRCRALSKGGRPVDTLSVKRILFEEIAIAFFLHIIKCVGATID